MYLPTYLPTYMYLDNDIPRLHLQESEDEAFDQQHQRCFEIDLFPKLLKTVKYLRE